MSLQSSEDDDSLDEAIAEIVAVIEDKNQMLGELGAFNNYVDKTRGEEVKKCLFFAHAQGIKTVHAGGGGVQKWQNSVHVVVECSLMRLPESL